MLVDDFAFENVSRSKFTRGKVGCQASGLAAQKFARLGRCSTSQDAGKGFGLLESGCGVLPTTSPGGFLRVFPTRYCFTRPPAWTFFVEKNSRREATLGADGNTSSCPSTSPGLLLQVLTRSVIAKYFQQVLHLPSRHALEHTLNSGFNAGQRWRRFSETLHDACLWGET